jgi:hypothetical protein
LISHQFTDQHWINQNADVAAVGSQNSVYGGITYGCVGFSACPFSSGNPAV